MANNNRGRGWWCAVASAAVLAISAAIAPGANGQVTRVERTADKAQLVNLATAPEVAPVARPAGLSINRPTIPMADYLAAKSAAAVRAPGQAKPGAAPPSATGVTLYAQVGSTNETQTTGGNVLPPDGDIATSATWMIQVNNDVVVMYNWFTNAFVSKKLSTFFRDGTDHIFDPRVIYDRNWRRFVAIADGCTACNGAVVSVLLLAISVTDDPTGDWWVGPLDPNDPGDFLDFPQLGMDLDSIIITYNSFLGAGGFDAKIFALPKAYLYNGLGFTYYVFGGSGCTNAPPYVLDNSGVDYVLAFCPGDNKVFIGSMTNSSRSNVDLHLWDNTVAVANYGIPPQAAQPGTAYTLDTGDNRFENRSLQVGSRILNTTAINYFGFAAPSYYNFNISASPHSLVSEGVFFASGSSFDWHPAINANRVAAPAGTPLGEIFTTWMSTDIGFPARNVQLRAAGWIGDSTGVLNGIPVYTSPIPLTNQTDPFGIHRTGDYSYIALYPDAALGCTDANEIGILTGETAGPAVGTWGTHVAIVKHC